MTEVGKVMLDRNVNVVCAPYNMRLKNNMLTLELIWIYASHVTIGHGCLRVFENFKNMRHKYNILTFKPISRYVYVTIGRGHLHVFEKIDFANQLVETEVRVGHTHDDIHANFTAVQMLEIAVNVIMNRMWAN